MNKEEHGVFGRSIFSPITQSLQDLKDWAVRTVRHQVSLFVLERFIFPDQGSIPLLPNGLSGNSLSISLRLRHEQPSGSLLLGRPC